MPTSDCAAARRNMVESQLKPNRVLDQRLIDAMSQVPRELFVPGSFRGVAYMDEDIPLGGGRFLMEPMVFARMLQAADIGPSDVVLDVGCGTGYSAAVLCRLAATVVALECDKQLLARAAQQLPQQDCDTAVLVEGPLEAGHPASAPYDVIVVEGAVQYVPDALMKQLAEGGRLVAVIRDQAVGKATLYHQVEGLITSRVLFDAGTPLLPGFARQPGFVF